MPSVGQRVSYELARDQQERVRAVRVELNVDLDGALDDCNKALTDYKQLAQLSSVGEWFKRFGIAP